VAATIAADPISNLCMSTSFGSLAKNPTLRGSYVKNEGEGRMLHESPRGEAGGRDGHLCLCPQWVESGRWRSWEEDGMPKLI
jgi:hypothetical protein